MKNKKNLFLTLILCSPLLFTSCLFTLLSERNLGINRAEYEDDTHFYLYFTGTESKWDLPDKDSLIVAKNLSDAIKGIESHKIVKIERDWWDIFMGGYLYRCEVSPEFQQGENILVTIKTGSIHEEIWGYAEFVVP
jgi:hypothetical protein